MNEQTKIKLFQNQEERLKWDEEIEEYYFSVVDVVGIFLVRVKTLVSTGGYLKQG